MRLEEIKVLGDHVLVRPIKTGCSLHKAGEVDLLIPATAHRAPHEGTVLAVGNGKRSKKTGERQALDLKVGDYVAWELMATTHAVEVDVDEHGPCVFLRTEQLLATVQ